MPYYRQISESEENFIINIEPVEVSKENIKVYAREDFIEVEINRDKEQGGKKETNQKDILNFPLKNRNLAIDLKNVSAKLSNKILTITAKLLKKEKTEKNVEIFDEKENIIEQKTKEINELKKNYDELKDKYLRLMADFENSRKFWDKRENELRTYGGLDLVASLLPIIDAMQLAFKEIKKDNTNKEIENKEKNKEIMNKHIDGLKMIFENFKKILFDHGLEEIDALNKKFDTRFHDAYMVENTDKFPDGTVIEEFQKGYMYKGIVLRTAKVKVSKGKN